MAISPLSIPGPVFSVWNFLKGRLAAARDKRDFRAEGEIADALRHADLNSQKYVISLYMRSGRTIVGRMGRPGEYDHEAYDEDRGTLTIYPERRSPEGVYYEQCTVLISQIEGFLLQGVYPSTFTD
jgi:hypothetical protein